VKRWLVLAVFALAACDKDPVVIDGSSSENFDRTAEEARRDLPVKDRLAFDIALRSPPGKRISDNEDEAASIARNAYDGMTAAEAVDINR
jgi:hypothetical protein